jgi:SAM-dependent methyltransferase
MSLSEHARRNREEWTKWAVEYGQRAPEAWEEAEITWGIWHVPESELRALPDVADKDVVELGCGTAYFSAWLARRGARPVGVDVTPAQLETARAMQGRYGIEFPLVEASAEEVPLPDASFDLALSEYGASIWADPLRWVPEAARLLRPGGELVFLVNGTLVVLCWPEAEDTPPGTELVRPYFGMHRFEWPGEDSVDFHLGYGDWIRLLRANGFEVLDLIEIQAPEGAEPHREPTTARPEWARSWPSEEVWRARKQA